MKIKFILSVYVVSLSLFFSAKEMVSSVEQGQTWLLEANSNKLSKGDSKVLYFFSTDAYNTYQARIFSDWDRFSIIDSRNLVRLNKGDRVEIIKSKHFERIYEVKLLDGFEKNRNYFVIREDLLKDFKLMENEDA
tara:strand:+ start:242 stop:646 length:405 start_codon:yes stop_codon:yes gene_type:complete